MDPVSRRRFFRSGTVALVSGAALQRLGAAEASEESSPSAATAVSLQAGNYQSRNGRAFASDAIHAGENANEAFGRYRGSRGHHLRLQVASEEHLTGREAA